ncbi:MAG TPA: hopanoid biosynthesis-associated protein HpnK [Candidatus Binataceae bacterium]|nr:hopanoid biosynthesis-associated protein HpnK [Candidatus Binataceae bacterium]
MTADDFGYSREVNAAVMSTFRDGVLTAASLMVAGAARDEAASIACEYPDLDVGLHVVICRGFSVLPHKYLEGLTDPTGRFPDQPVVAGMKYFFERRLRSCLRDELRAQVETHLKLVGKLKHLDGHLNFHVHPIIAGILIDLATEYQVPCIRLPREPIIATLRLAADNFPRKVIESIIFKALSRRMLKLMQGRGIGSSDRLFGLHQTGHLSQEYVLGLIDRLPPGTTEIYFHPAEQVNGQSPSTAAQVETQILKSPRVRQALMDANVCLTTFARITSEQQSAKGQSR